MNPVRDYPHNSPRPCTLVERGVVRGKKSGKTNPLIPTPLPQSTEAKGESESIAVKLGVETPVESEKPDQRTTRLQPDREPFYGVPTPIADCSRHFFSSRL